MNVNYKHIKIYKKGDNSMFWFRLFGYGITGKKISIHRLLFSQRNGYRKGFNIFGWYFEFLKPVIKTLDVPS